MRGWVQRTFRGLICRHRGPITLRPSEEDWGDEPITMTCGRCGSEIEMGPKETIVYLQKKRGISKFKADLTVDEILDGFEVQFGQDAVAQKT